MPCGEFKIRYATLAEILSLRQAVIIDGTDRDSPYFEGDDNPETRQVGAFEQGQCVGCATYLPSEWEEEPAWRLRGMATTPDRRAEGIGAAILSFAEQALAKDFPARQIMWCTARVTAAGFYERHGWHTVPERFDIVGVGPHYRMFKQLTP